MSIYAISDLHLSFNTDKPMNVFGWDDYENKIKDDWLKKVTDNDLVILPGDFSWEMNIENTYKDFSFINNLPGKKLLLKGNHDYWWTTVTSMKNYLRKNNFSNIDFLYNNSFEFENKIICGTRGWIINNLKEEDEKILLRESQRLELSIKSGISKYGSDKEIFAFMHYPPITKRNTITVFTEILKKYHVKKCIYGHLHGQAQEDGVCGIVNNIEYIMTSCDYTNFKLIKIL